MNRYRSLGIAALPLVLALAACSSSTTTPSPSAVPSVAASQPAASFPPASEPAASQAAPSASSETTDAYPLKVATGTVGSYITAENGMTLYTFKNDTADSGRSTCNGGCATTWPPFTVDSLDEVKPDSGVTGKLALVTRDDGTKQVSYNGTPVYYYSGDTKAGDTNGQNFGPGKWFVANP